MKDGRCLNPVYPEDHEKMAGLKEGQPYLVKVKKIRNVKQHRLYFKVLGIVFENQEQYDNFDHFRKVIQMKAGYYDIVETKKGTVYLPKSISFENLDQDGFQELFDKVLHIIYREFGIDGETLIEEAQ